MALTLTTKADQASQQVNKTPQIVLEIEGVSTIYGVVPVEKVLKIGDDYDIGDPDLYIGVQVLIEDQKSLISFTAGTSSDISQTLNLDKGTNESLTSMRVALVDINQNATNLVSPGQVVTDILGRRCKVWLGFTGTAFKDDYLVIFRGVVDTVDAKSGVVILNLSQDVKKLGAIFPKGQTKLTGNMTNVQTTADVESTADFMSVYTGASGAVDDDLKLYIRIGDEIMRYESSSALQFATITRGALGTTNVAHTTGDAVDSFYVLEGNVIDLALKVMLSGTNGPFVSSVPITNFVRISPTEAVDNSIFFQNLDLATEYNLQLGDYITTTGASNGTNNVTNKQIVGITESDSGYYIEVTGVTFVEENDSAAVVSFRSQYDVFGTNGGLKMVNDEVDIFQHIDIQQKYLASTSMKLYLKEDVSSGIEFLAKEFYNPISCFSLPRKSQSSMGIHQGPIPGVNIKTLNNTTVTNAANISIQRSINKNFFNTVIYRFEENALEDKFNSGVVTIDGTSISQIPVGNRALTIDSKGLRDSLSGINIAQAAASRRLNKYKYGAELISGIKVLFKTGFDIEIGDKVIVDMASLKISDLNTGTRSGEPRLFEVVNRNLKISTGEISFDLIDSNFNLAVRYSLIGPASKVKTGIDGTSFVIKPSYNTTRYGNSEYKKWENFIGAFVKVHSADFATSGTAYISSIVGNTITLDASLGFTPAADYIMELGDYDNQTSDVKLVYCAMSDADNNFADGKTPYQQS